MSMTWIFVTTQRCNFVTLRESISTRHLVTYFKHDGMDQINRQTSCIYERIRIRTQRRRCNDDDNDKITACGKV